MDRRGLLPALEQTPVVAILRGCPYRHVLSVAGAAVDAGLRVVEVTLDSERPLDQISAIATSYPEAVVGVGSLRRAAEIGPAVEAGARFVVSPIVFPEVIETAGQQGVASIPGAATPTEIDHAARCGATAVKVFPIEQLGGPAFLRAIMAPLGSPALIPTGGVAIGSIAAYLETGAVAVGLGGALFPKAALEIGDTGTVERHAKKIIEALP
jgi:2-dehydro-3-deoxyphosphogluconate aldolase/(4S)-4-hydroxy-2-oxoglutarate aldolase